MNSIMARKRNWTRFNSRQTAPSVTLDETRTTIQNLTEVSKMLLENAKRN
jgi:hypothetical protein